MPHEKMFIACFVFAIILAIAGIYLYRHSTKELTREEIEALDDEYSYDAVHEDNYGV